jgi:hypothetical protein
MQQVPLAEGLFTWPPEPGKQPALIGGQASNGKIFFPYPLDCAIHQARAWSIAQSTRCYG